jgi:hypothetical protein
MINITIDQIMAVIDDNYAPTRAELLLLIDIVRDCKLTEYPLQIKCSGIRSKHKELDSISIMELFDYKIKVDPEELRELTDKKRLIINNNRVKRIYKQKF